MHNINVYMHTCIMYTCINEMGVLTVGISLSHESTKTVFHFCSPLHVLPLPYSSTTPPPSRSTAGGVAATPRLTALLRERQRGRRRERERDREGEGNDEIMEIVKKRK